MRKPAFSICENKDADQLRGSREYTDTTIPLLSGPLNAIIILNLKKTTHKNKTKNKQKPYSVKQRENTFANPLFSLLSIKYMRGKRVDFYCLD